MSTPNTVFTATPIPPPALVIVSPVVNPTPYTDPSGNNFYVYTFIDTSATGYSMQFYDVSTPITLNCLAVAGGGGGGFDGGGGAGGMIETTYTVSSSQNIPIVVGGGGGGGFTGNGYNGSKTTIGSTINAVGGGFGAGFGAGGGGGSGGGASSGGSAVGGSGTAGQGNKGGIGGSAVGGAGGSGGGGGAKKAGGNGGGLNGKGIEGGAGGEGKSPSSTINGIPTGIPTTTVYATGGQGYASVQVNPQANTGNGGSYSKAGGSGIVIISILASSIAPG